MWRPVTGPEAKRLDELRHDRVLGSRHDLVDELRLVIFPVVLGAGELLFGEAGDVKPLRLVGTRTVGDGLILLTYRPG